MQEQSMLYPRETNSRRVVSLDGMWKFQIDFNSVGRIQGWKDGLPNPDLIPVPASFQDFYTEKEIREFTGDVWYETEFFLPREWEGNEAAIRFGCATHRAEVYINGTKVTVHEGGFTPFLVPLNDSAVFSSWNRVVVMVNNELSNTSLPCGETKILSNGRKMSKPYFDFFNYSGLQRPVKLILVPKESITDFSIDSKLQGTDAIIAYHVTTNGTHPITVEVYDESGTLITQAQEKDGTLTIPNVRLWQVRNAYLYRFVFKIFNQNQLLDEYYEDIGIRIVEIKGTKILINGKPVYLKGFGKHEDSDIIGRGFSAAVMKRDFECMKWIHANSFRTSHYPYSEEIYQMADREGFLIIDEVAAVGMFESIMNFMEASTGKHTAFFTKETTSKLMQNHKEAIKKLIQRDKNHASVIAWSLFNEPETTDEAAVAYFEEIFHYAKECDPQKRPCTFALIMNSLPDTCKCYQFSDFICLNRYYGWYFKGGYEISEAEEAFRKELDGWKEKNLNVPFIFSEYGADTNPSEHKLPSVMWSQEYQIEYLMMCSKVFDSYDFIQGEQVWNFADFQTTEGIMRMNGNKKGIFTRQRQPKDAAYYLKQRWASLEEEHL